MNRPSESEITLWTAYEMSLLKRMATPLELLLPCENQIFEPHSTDHLFWHS